MENNLEEQYSQELLILADYLEIPVEELDEIEDEGNNEFTYCNTTYRVVDEKGFDNLIEDKIESITYDVQWSIDNEDYSEINYQYYISMSVNEDAIEDDVKSDPEGYLGEYTKFEDYYIFEI